MKIRLRLMSLLLALSLTLSGCWDQRIYEQSGLVLCLGIDLSDHGKLLFTLTYPVIGGSEKNAMDIISTEANLLREARTQANYVSPKKVEGGKIQQLLVSDSLAASGIHDLMEIYQRDPTNPAIAYIVVVEGSAQELLIKASEFKNKPRVGFYLFELLENNEQSSNIPNTKVFDFDINYFAPGLDPITPLIKLKENDVSIEGCALFSGDKMVGKLDTKQTTMLLALMGQLKRNDFVFDDPEFTSTTKNKRGIAALLQKPKRKITIDFDNSGNLLIDVNLSFKIVLDEYRWDDTNDETAQNNIEKIMAHDLEKRCNEITSYLQEINSDPIGFGNLLRAKYNDYWNSIKWADAYQEATIKVKVEAEIIKEGIIK